jgi:TetR/AcrR family transcriptional repressor of nem operon
MAKPRIPRNTILKNSLNAFKQKGYHGTSMADLAAANGILKGSIYHYITSKESLMVEILNALKDHYIQKVFSKAYNLDLSPNQKLNELFKRTREIVCFQNGGDFFMNIGLETKREIPEFNAIISSFYAEWEKVLSHVYADLMETTEAQAKAKKVLAELQGGIHLSTVLGNWNYLDAAINNYAQEYANMQVAS